MKKSAEAQPVWVESRQRWQLNVMVNGDRKSFYSSDPRQRVGPAECRKKYREWVEANQDHDNLSFTQAWERYLKDYKKRCKITSYNAVVSKGKAHLEKRFKHKKLNNIRKSEWQKVIYDAHDNGAASKVTLMNIATMIRSFCKFCASQDLMPDANVPLFFSYPQDATKGKKDILQPHQLKMLFEPEEDDDWFVPIFRFVVLTGLRRGEVCALQSSRDLSGDIVSVRESLSHEGYLIDPKSADSIRDVTLTSLAMDQIKLHMLHRQEAGVISKYLFCRPNAEQIPARHLADRWRTWRAEHGISITLHELRHTYISYTRQRTSLGLDDLKELYGHSKDMDTDRVYVHDIAMTEDQRKEKDTKRREAAAEIDTVFKDIVRSSGQ